MQTRRQKSLITSESNGIERKKKDVKQNNIKETPIDKETKVKKMRRSKSIAKPEELPNTSTSENDSSAIDLNSPEIHACYNAIKQVVTTKYASVVERLQLHYPAKCTRALKVCSENHNRNANIPISENQITSQTFLKNHQFLMFIKVIQMDVLQGQFPGRNAFQSLFELILSVNHPSNNEYKVSNVINSAAITISNIIGTFTPCWLGANTEYRHFIRATKKILISDSTELLDNRTLINDIINGIETAIQPTTLTSTSSVDESFNDSYNDSMLLNFHQWESKNAQKFSFDQLKRDDKIDRMFLVLSLFVQLFEADLAMWTIKNLQNPSEKLSINRKNPLVGLVLWTDNESIEVNYNIKNILKLYINYIKIDFPMQHTKVLGRFVNLIFNIFDLREMRVNDMKINYPQSLQYQSQFCDAFTKIIFDIVGCNIDTWLKIIRMVDHPRLKLYLITALLTKIDHKNVLLNPKNGYHTLKQIENNSDDFDDDDIGQNNNVVKRVKTKTDVIKTTTMRYPCLQKVTRRAVGELSTKQHVELHLIALNAYISVYHIKDFYKYWKNYDELEKEKITALGQYKQEMKSYQQEPKQLFDLMEMERIQIETPFNQRVKEIGETSEIYNMDVIIEDAGISKTIDIHVNTKKYRDDIKFIDKIISEMPKLQAKFGSLFPQLD